MDLIENNTTVFILVKELKELVVKDLLAKVVFFLMRNWRRKPRNCKRFEYFFSAVKFGGVEVRVKSISDVGEKGGGDCYQSVTESQRASTHTGGWTIGDSIAWWLLVCGRIAEIRRRWSKCLMEPWRGKSMYWGKLEIGERRSRLGVIKLARIHIHGYSRIE